MLELGRNVCRNKTLTSAHILASLYELFIYEETCVTLKQFRTVKVLICTDDSIQSFKDIFLAQLIFITPHTTTVCSNSTQNIQTDLKV